MKGRQFAMKKILRPMLVLLLAAVVAATGFDLAGTGGTAGFRPSQAFAAVTPESDFLLPVVPKAFVPEGYTGIYTKADLDAMRNNLGGSYILMDDIVFAPEDFQTGGAFYNGGRGWNPIGNYDDNVPFTGILNGNGKSIVGLTFDAYLTTSGETYLSAGLFGYLSGLVQDLRMESADFRYEVVPLNNLYLGAVAGYSEGVVQNTVVTGTVEAPNVLSCAGGIAGHLGGTRG